MNSAQEFDTEEEEESSAVVEQTIETMETLQLCIHPIHKHSFAPVSFLISGPMRTCAGCNQRLNSVLNINPSSHASLVRCVACYAYAHRSCAFSTDTTAIWNETCPVNSALVVAAQDDNDVVVESTTDDDDVSEEQNNNLLEQSAVFLEEPKQETVAAAVQENVDILVSTKDSDSGSEERNNALEQSVVLLEGPRRENSETREDSMVRVEKEEEEEESNVLVESIASFGVSTSGEDSFENMKAPLHFSPSKSLADSLSEESFVSTNSAQDEYVMESSPPIEPPVLVSEQDHHSFDRNDNDENLVHVEQEKETITLDETDVVETLHDMSPFTQVRKIPSSDLLPPLPANDIPETPLTGGDRQTPFEEDEMIMVWTQDGPPQHWASKKSLEGISKEINQKPSEEEDEARDDELAEKAHAEPLHYETHPFASVSRVLQENIIPFFRQGERKTKQQESNEIVTSTDSSNESGGEDYGEDEAADESVAVLTKSKEEGKIALSDVDVKSLLTEVQPPPREQENSVVKMAKDGIAAVKTSAQARKKLGLVSVAGGIAGGAAGLLVAGPAGAVIGAKFGQTAGALGVIIEGSVGVGVFVAGVAAASFTAQQLQQKEEKRILTIGQAENRKVLLVRPNVVVDPIWDEICAEAIRSAPSMKRRPFGILPSSSAQQAENAKRERNRRDSDIVETDEYEIPTEDKVLLLVSRSLNDKFSLPGHVYRCLIREHRARCERREIHHKAVAETTVVEDNASSEASDLESPSILRERRRDAHGVIKQVTATLLEVRPGFASSPKITEMSATAVEGLVFGELYDLVFEEIVEETKATDELLMTRILEFERSQISENNDRPLGWRDGISEHALQELRMIPESHSAVDKMRNCVDFLELISLKFSASGSAKHQSSANGINADSLLKMVCQHIIAAKVPHINAEICFLEEFARDEHLLRGKEGYALVTMQASLHFLNCSTDIETDIFMQDENDDSVPLTSESAGAEPSD